MNDTATAPAWPTEGYTRAPYRVYSDRAICARKQQRRFRSSSWHYLGLKAEVPEVG